MDRQIPEVVQEVINKAEGQTLSGEQIEEAKDEPTTIAKEKKVSRIDQKRQQILIDRIKRKMNEVGKDGKPKTQQQALTEIAEEDYQRLPPEKKVQRLETVISGIARQVGYDMMNLRRNDGAIADAFDINYRGISKMFRHLGLTEEQEKAFMKEANEEFKAERQAKIDAEAKAQANNDEKARVEAEVLSKESEQEKPKVNPHIEQGATVFGSES